MNEKIVISTPEKESFIASVASLDEEGFNAIAWMIYQQSKEAGGFEDHEGWARVRAAAEKLPFIAKEQRADDAAAAADDAKPITVTEGDVK